MICPMCEGKGRVRLKKSSNTNKMIVAMETRRECPMCNGKGVVSD